MRTELKNVCKIQLNYKSGIQVEMFCLNFNITDYDWKWECCGNPETLKGLAYQVKNEGLTKDSYINILNHEFIAPFKIEINNIESVFQLGLYIDIPFIIFD